MNDDTLAGIVAARICHDLVSPIGAIGNAIDLMEEFAAGDTGEERRVLRGSAERASAILRLHRLAFGTPRDDASAHARADLAKLIEDAVGGNRVEMRWIGLPGPALTAPQARSVALLAMVGRAVLGLRGRLTVTLALDEFLPVGVAAEGDGAKLDPMAEALLLQTARDAPAPRQVELALLPIALGHVGARLATRIAPGTVALTALPG